MARHIARFDSPDTLVAAVRRARRDGYVGCDAFTPFPVPGLAEALGFRERWIPVLALVSALLCATGGYFMQWYSAVIDYPFVVGGKPLSSWPAFLLVTFALGILAAALTAVLGMLAASRLPQPYHPAFDWSAFDRASDDSFFLLIESEDREAVRRFFDDTGASETEEVP